MAGQTIQIFVPSGDPRQMRIAEITMRIVRAFEIPRSQLSEFLARRESDQVGVYFLFGEGEAGLQPVYIGQSDGIGSRLQNHNVKSPQKDFWTRAVAVVSITNNWTRTHTTYIEWLSIREASTIDRFVLNNGNTGSKTYTTEALEADCDEAFDTMRLLLTTLGYPLFEPLVTRGTDESTVSAVPTYFCSGKGGANATGRYTAEGFVVFKGSSARRQLVESLQIHEPFVVKRQALLDSGKVVDTGDALTFAEDVLFSSPSSAATMILGRTSNGWLDWITNDGRSLDQIERNQG